MGIYASLIAGLVWQIQVVRPEVTGLGLYLLKVAQANSFLFKFWLVAWVIFAIVLVFGDKVSRSTRIFNAVFALLFLAARLVALWVSGILASSIHPLGFVIVGFVAVVWAIVSLLLLGCTGNVLWEARREKLLIGDYLAIGIGLVLLYV